MFALTVSILLLVQYVIAMLFSALAVIIAAIPAAESGTWVAIFSTAGTAAMLGIVLVMLLRYQSIAPAVGGAPVGDGTADAHWKLGMIYYNPDDPALWVEKRFGIGYTTNMARPAAWLLLLGIIGFAIGAVVFAMQLGR
ncbi:MAG: DUF5808 domain-containing protein [Thermomicrobiales bacterium]